MTGQPNVDKILAQWIHKFEFNPFAVDIRYPGDFEPINPSGAVQVIKLAKKIKAIVKNVAFRQRIVKK